MNQKKLLTYGSLAGAGLLLFQSYRRKPQNLSGLVPDKKSRDKMVDHFVKKNNMNPYIAHFAKNAINQVVDHYGPMPDIIDVTPNKTRAKP